MNTAHMNEIVQNCWVLTDGVVGMVSQALGLAEAVGLPIEQKNIVLRQPWRSLPAAFWPSGVIGVDPMKGAPLAAPWPRLVISCGRKSVGPALAVKRNGGANTFAVAIQNPHVSLDSFDLVVAPQHDRITGANVFSTLGAVHRVSDQKLGAAREQDPDAFADLPRPLIAVLIGGPNRAYRMTPDFCRDLAHRLKEAAATAGAGMVITASRRTGPENETVLRDILQGEHIEFWDGTGENPYFKYLAHADALITTGDSVNMVSEAASTGRPVYTIDLEMREGGRRAASKFMAFHEALRDAGSTRLFEQNVDLTWQPDRLQETGRIAQIIRDRLGLG